MTDLEKIQMVKTMCDEADTDTISVYLFVAEQKICHRLFDDSVTELPSKGYDGLHIEATVYMLNKRGAEGETVHNENGVNRAYENADLPDSLFRGYTAKAVAVS